MRLFLKQCYSKLDFDTKIEDSILKYNPTLIFVEHDKIFVEKVATKIITIEK